MTTEALKQIHKDVTAESVDEQMMDLEEQTDIASLFPSFLTTSLLPASSLLSLSLSLSPPPHLPLTPEPNPSLPQMR